MPEPADHFTRLPDLALRGHGGAVIAASDESFAPRENLVKPGPAVLTPHTFGAKGQVYDGWETRRRRGPGHDWAIVRLGLPGVIRGVVIDTAHFTGNHPEYASVDACAAAGHPSAADLRERAAWTRIVPESPLFGDTRHEFGVPTAGDTGRRFTHVRLNIHPDGGVARLRVHGEVVPDPALLAGLTIDLAALENGGAITGCSDAFYSSPVNLIAPGLARNQAEGWETARRRDGGNDWVTIRLAGQGRVRLAELDTTNLIHNAPSHARLTAVDAVAAPPEDPSAWFELLPRTRLQPDTRHRFRLPGHLAPPLTCASTSTRTAGWPASACTATSPPRRSPAWRPVSPRAPPDTRGPRAACRPGPATLAEAVSARS